MDIQEKNLPEELKFEDYIYSYNNKKSNNSFVYSCRWRKFGVLNWNRSETKFNV